MTFEPIKNQTFITGDTSVKVILNYENGKSIVFSEVNKFTVNYQRRDINTIEFKAIGFVPMLLNAKGKIINIKIIGEKGWFIPIDDWHEQSYVWDFPCEMTMISFDVYADFDPDSLNTESVFTLEGYIY